jgi:hypothetical protein
MARRASCQLEFDLAIVIQPIHTCPVLGYNLSTRLHEILRKMPFKQPVPTQAKEPLITTAFGTTNVPRSQSRSKRSGVQCRKPAMRGKAVCHTHGGASTRRKAEQGRKRCAAAKTIHGRETRDIRLKRADMLSELRGLEQVMVQAGLIR